MIGLFVLDQQIDKIKLTLFDNLMHRIHVRYEELRMGLIEKDSCGKEKNKLGNKHYRSLNGTDFIHLNFNDFTRIDDTDI